MQIGNHAFGQNAMGISRMGIGQYQNVANKGKEQSATNDVAKMLQRNMDSLEMSPQAQKMTAPESKTEKGNISAQEVSKENATNGTKNPEVTSQVPSATETLAALGYDMEQMNDTVTVKEEVVTERVLDEGILQDANPTSITLAVDGVSMEFNIADPKTDYMGRTVQDYVLDIFRKEDSSGFLPMEDAIQISIDEYNKINASDISDEEKSIAKEMILEAIEMSYGNMKFDFIAHEFVIEGDDIAALREQYKEAREVANELTDQLNTNKNAMVDSIIKHLQETDGATTLKDTIAVANQSGTMSFEDTFDFYEKKFYGITANELLGKTTEEVFAKALEGIRSDNPTFASQEYMDSIARWRVAKELSIAEYIKQQQEELKDSGNAATSQAVATESEDEWKKVIQSEISTFLQETGTGDTLEEMLQARDAQHNAEDELLNQISDLVFQDEMESIGS